MCLFAQQLAYVLAQHKKHLGSLHSITIPSDVPSHPPKSVHSVTIDRLKSAAAGDCSKSVTLNAAELEAVERTYTLTPEEINRLHSALAGEFVFRYLLDRTGDATRALRAGEYVFHLLFDADERALVVLRALARDEIRVGEDDEDDEDNHTHEQEATTSDAAHEQRLQPELQQRLQADLEPTIELYAEALLCLEAARAARNPLIQQGYVAMATSLLTNAQELIAYPPASVQGSPQQHAWQELIAEALEEASRI